MTIAGAARSAPDAAALLSVGASISFGELDRRHRLLGGAMHAGGLVRGDRIAVLARNRVEFLEVTTGALRAGIVPVPISPLLAAPEIAYIIEDSGARWLFTDIATERPGQEKTITFGDAYERLLHDAEPVDIADVMLTRPMHYTSGTSGTPKGVWVPPAPHEVAVRMSEQFRTEWGLGPDDIHLVCSPLSHSAPHRFAARSLESGGAVFVTDRFDERETLASIELFSITTTFVVPTHLERMMRLGHGRIARHDLGSIRLLAHAGAPVRETTKKRVIEVFPPDCVWEFYGSTEGPGTRISAAEWLRKPGSVGTPRPGARIAIRSARGADLPAGEVGRVWIEDPAAERFSYWNDPKRTREAWQDGAFTVGDRGWLDEDGYLYLAGREGDLIITGGVNVYPHEVETVLADHPAVQDVVVYGVEDDEWGQIVVAAVVPSFGQPLDPALLRKWARERLSGPRCPKQIVVVDRLPQTPTGKVMRPR